MHAINETATIDGYGMQWKTQQKINDEIAQKCLWMCLSVSVIKCLTQSLDSDVCD